MSHRTSQVPEASGPDGEPSLDPRPILNLLVTHMVWHSDAKRQRLHRDVVGDAKGTHESVGPVQLHNIARLASLEAMQRFRTHDIKMPWEKGPLAPVFGAPAPALSIAKTFTPPMVGLVDTLAPTVLTRQDSPGPVGPISKFAIKRIAAAKCVVPEDEMLARCLNQIKSLLLMDLQGTEVGITLCNLAGGLDESADVLQILRDCFARKSYSNHSQTNLIALDTCRMDGRKRTDRRLDHDWTAVVSLYVCLEGSRCGPHQGESSCGGVELFWQCFEIQENGLQRHPFIESLGGSAFNVPGQEETQTGPSTIGGSGQNAWDCVHKPD